MKQTNNNYCEPNTNQRKKMDKKLDSVGWGIFFVWIGIAILADLGWGIVLIGVGTIILGSVVAREYLPCSDESNPSKVKC